MLVMARHHTETIRLPFVCESTWLGFSSQFNVLVMLCLFVTPTTLQHLAFCSYFSLGKVFTKVCQRRLLCWFLAN